MPFTLSHPAAVLPLMRSPFSTVALVAGAVAPDMSYFVGSVGTAVTAQSWYEPFLNATTAHALRGMVTVDLAYALILCGLAWLARRPVEALVPTLAVTGRRRSDGSRSAVVRGWWVLLSLLVGTATHLVWDSFTHGDGYVVTHVSWLSSSLVGGLTVARALQHVSTVGGLVVITVYLWRRRSRWGSGEPGRGSVDRRGRVMLGIIGAVVVAGAVAGAARVWANADGLSAGQLIEGMVSDGAKGAGAGLVIALILYTAAWWAHRGVVVARDDGIRR